MKRALSTIGLLGALLATLSISTIAKDKTMTWKGWISESMCGAKGASADHRNCAIKCRKEGASWVIVDSKSKKVIMIHNQDAVNADADLGTEVNVTGHMMEDGSVQVDKIAPAMKTM